jgi:hypothetical protein
MGPSNLQTFENARVIPLSFKKFFPTKNDSKTFTNSHDQKGRVWIYLHSTTRALENALEDIAHVIIDQSSMVIHAFSTTGRQVNINYTNPLELHRGIQRCTAWLPSERILMKM